MIRRWRLAAALALGLAFGPAGAARAQEAPCPAVEVPAATARLVAFRPGPSRGTGDMTLDGRLAKAAARCSVANGRLTVQLRLEIVVRRGPANQDRRADLAYFVALTDDRGGIRDKWIFPAEAAFGERARLRLSEELELVIPLPRGSAPAGHRIYVGFQLSQEQLRYNRAAP